MIGIGGIGMSALARYFCGMGKNVAGYDRVRTPLCEALEKEGIAIHYEDSVDLIPENFRSKENTVAIYTPAIPQEHQELNFFKEQNFELLKRAAVLGKISRNHECLAVAGTHGKTTTSALLAHLFKNAGKSVTAFLGGISVNYQTNFLAGTEKGILVAEADEYDRSFLQLQPTGAIITSTDSDHLDVYGTAEHLKNTFVQFAQSISGPRVVHKRTGLDGLSYALEEEAHFEGRNLRIENHSYLFDIASADGENITDIRSGLPGRHNVENAVAAAALALQFGLAPDEVKNGIASFKGVRRRFEYHIKQENLVYIDDYAHHPAEINALISSVRELYPGKKITGIFQPHLYSRTRDYADEFAIELGKLDELILMEIYPAREKPIPGINSNMLLQKSDLEKKDLLGTIDILNKFDTKKPEVILTIGAGDIDQLVNPLKMKLLQ